MRTIPFLITLVPLLASACLAQTEEDASPTEQLKDSVREWIETMREIQQEEDSWSRDQEVLEDQKAALEIEIKDLAKRVEEAKEVKAEADRESLEQEEERETLIEAKELMSREVAELEKKLIEQFPAFPKWLSEEDAKVKGMMQKAREYVVMEEDDAAKALNARLSNVLNLLTEAEKWQQLVHLRKEMHEGESGKNINMDVVYFGLAAAYAADEEGEFAAVGRPGPEGWVFEKRDDLAAEIAELVRVIKGDAEAKFSNLPIELK